VSLSQQNTYANRLTYNTQAHNSIIMFLRLIVARK